MAARWAQGGCADKVCFYLRGRKATTLNDADELILGSCMEELNSLEVREKVRRQDQHFMNPPPAPHPAATPASCRFVLAQLQPNSWSHSGTTHSQLQGVLQQNAFPGFYPAGCCPAVTPQIPMQTASTAPAARPSLELV